MSGRSEFVFPSGEIGNRRLSIWSNPEGWWTAIPPTADNHGAKMSTFDGPGTKRQLLTILVQKRQLSNRFSWCRKFIFKHILQADRGDLAIDSDPPLAAFDARIARYKALQVQTPKP